MLGVHNLTVAYPDKTIAVKDFTLHIEKGENVALVGANGAGKTTLLLAIVGVIQAAAGSIAIDGIPLGRDTLNKIHSLAGLVFQNPDDQLFTASIYDDVAFAPRNYGLPDDEVKKRVGDTLAKLGIAHLRDRSTLKLSGGEKRTAAIATVLAMNPSLMLFDEPTAFLDPKARRTLINLLADMPHTKLIASHDVAFLAETCRRVVLMKSGSVFADGRTEELLYDKQIMQECDLEALEKR